MSSTEQHATMTVYLLGTGGPEFTVSRTGISTLIAAGDSHFLFDTGRGTAQRIYECQIPFSSIDKVFYTHLHSDHIEGLPNLWMSPWFLVKKFNPLSIYGPVGTKAMTDGMLQMFGKDYRDRSNDLFKQSYLQMDVHEFSREGVVYDDGAVRITAYPVEHADGNPAYGYCVEYQGFKVILSGDTTYHDNTVTYGKGSDLIVHNVIGIPPELTEDYMPVIRKLTTPEQAAEIFNRTAPRMAVFSHICKKKMTGTKGDDEILNRVRKAGYSGPLAMGRDRMKIIIDQEQVTVIEPGSIDDLEDLQ